MFHCQLPLENKKEWLVSDFPFCTSTVVNTIFRDHSERVSIESLAFSLIKKRKESYEKHFFPFNLYSNIFSFIVER